jgi:hypothetical protein
MSFTAESSGNMPETPPTNITHSSTANTNSTSRTFYTAHETLTPHNPLTRTPITAPTTGEQQCITNPPLSLDIEAMEAKVRFWGRITETLSKLHKRSYHLYNASAYIISPNEELALLAEVRAINADGQRTWGEMLLSLKDSADEEEQAMFQSVLEYSKELEVFERFCRERQRLLQLLKW